MLGVVLGVVLELVLVGFVEVGAAGLVVWTSAGTVGVMSEGGMGDMGGYLEEVMVDLCACFKRIALSECRG